MIADQIQHLRDRFGNVDVRALPSGSSLVTVPSIPLPEGWNRTSTSIRFLLPVGYPYAALDCFWADIDLRLAGEGLPQNTNITTPIPEVPEPGLWFSWHLTQPWNPSRDTLSSWMNIVLDRLRRAL